MDQLTHPSGFRVLGVLRYYILMLSPAYIDVKLDHSVHLIIGAGLKISKFTNIYNFKPLDFVSWDNQIDLPSPTSLPENERERNMQFKHKVGRKSNKNCSSSG